MKTTHEATMDHDNVIRLLTVRAIGRAESMAHAKAHRIAADVIDALSQARVAACLPEIVHVDTGCSPDGDRVLIRIRVEMAGNRAEMNRAYAALRRIAKAVH